MRCPGLHTVRLDTWQVYRGHARATDFFKRSTRGDCPPVTIGSSLVQLERLPESAFSGRQDLDSAFSPQSSRGSHGLCHHLAHPLIKSKSKPGSGERFKGLSRLYMQEPTALFPAPQKSLSTTESFTYLLPPLTDQEKPLKITGCGPQTLPPKKKQWRKTKMMTSRYPSGIAQHAGVWVGVLTHSASNPAFTLLPMGGSSSDLGYRLGSSILEKPGASRIKYSIVCTSFNLVLHNLQDE